MCWLLYGSMSENKKEIKGNWYLLRGGNSVKTDYTPFRNDWEQNCFFQSATIFIRGFICMRANGMTMMSVGITHGFSCINICRVPRKLFEHKAARPSLQISSKGPGKCYCEEITMDDHYSCITYDSNGKLWRKRTKIPCNLYHITIKPRRRLV